MRGVWGHGQRLGIERCHGAAAAERSGTLQPSGTILERQENSTNAPKTPLFLSFPFPEITTFGVLFLVPCSCTFHTLSTKSILCVFNFCGNDLNAYKGWSGWCGTECCLSNFTIRCGLTLRSPHVPFSAESETDVPKTKLKRPPIKSLSSWASF